MTNAIKNRDNKDIDSLRTYYMDVNIAKNVDFYVQNRENFQCFLMSKPHQFTLFSYFYVYFMPKTKGFMPLTT